MGKCIRANQPCPCGKSSDAYQYYDDGEHCFSCGTTSPHNSEAKKIIQPTEGEVTYEYRPWRGVTAETMQTYGALTKCLNGVPYSLIFPTVLPPSGLPRVGQVRIIADKQFYSVGENPDGLLFGESAFPPGSSDSITITEGALDAMSSFQMTGRPAVSIPGANTARKAIRQRFQYLNSFPKIRVATDADDPGEQARAAIKECFEYGKCLDVELSHDRKDANGYLERNEGDIYKRLWWNAKARMPQGILSTFQEFDEAIDDQTYQAPIATWPFPELEGKLMGIRPGEITLITAPEGIGKTEIIRAVEHHILKTTDLNLGTIHLEENKSRSLKGLAGLELREPVHFPDTGRSADDIKRALHDLVRREQRLHVYSNFGGDTPDVICDMIRFLVVACGCRVITLDHITMLATGNEDEDERKFLDILSTRLGKMVVELAFHLILVSHVNDEGKTRGSRNIAKVAWNRVDLARDITHADESIRNTTSLLVSKARFSSLTGPAGQLFFDRETFTLMTSNDNFDAHAELPS